ncbi:transposase [Rhizobiales bacterium RZME27]|uniref:Transposase n=1 Tax=Endobacterium cereale TaxID=2663029 RepID=A0A6A8A876_9HYPH|nr:helix-turn-helix domain-containing protein [Endobacterium cereale]MEB2847111.1 helix-turn-helix domain-containing protein [Endobacterium cereale]MQY47472.1 transposase [Endobacterium cereale]
MQTEFSIRITGTCPVQTPLPPPSSAWVGVSFKRICRGVRLLVWEALVLASGQMAELRDRRRIACHVRQIAMYVCHVALRMPMGGIADACGRDRSTVSHACHLTEDRRDDPLFDAFVACVERMALAAFGRMEEVAYA